MPRPRNTNPHCNEPGCNQPRMVGSTGKKQPKCETHMREYWRLKASEKQGSAPDNALVQPEQPEHQTQTQQMQQRAAQRKAQAQAVIAEVERCPVCQRTPDQAAAWMLRGITCHACAHRLPQANNRRNKRPEISIIRVNHGANTLDILAAHRVKSLDMPETEGELHRLLEVYERSGHLVARS